MPTISVKPLSPFDATNDTSVSFDFIDGQSVINTINVYEDQSGELVYSHSSSYPTYTLSHTIPGETLSNGKSYHYTITAGYHTGRYILQLANNLTVGEAYYFNIVNVNYTFIATSNMLAESELTFDPNGTILECDGIQVEVIIGNTGTALTFEREVAFITSAVSTSFWCASDPVVEFANISDDTIVGTSAFTAELKYTQKEGERLSEYIVGINGSDGNQIFNTGSMFAFSKTEYLYTQTSNALPAGTYTFTVNGISRSFTTTQASDAGTVFAFDPSASILTATFGDITTAVEVTNSADGTYLAFDTVAQYAEIPIDGLADDNKYTIFMRGQTTHGLLVSIVGVTFSASYDTPSVFGVISVDSLPLDGVVRVTSNMSAVDGVANGDVEFVNGRAVLTDQFTTVTFNDGFAVDDTFCLRGGIADINYDSVAVAFSSGTHRYTVTFHNNDLGNGPVCYGVLHQAGVGVPSFWLMSNCISPPASEEVVPFVITYNGSRYSFKIGGNV